MRRLRRTGVVLAILGAALAARADDAPPRTGPAVLFLGPRRPIILQVDILVNCEPLETFYDEFLKQEFKRLDADGDGTLNAAERERLPSRDLLTAVGLAPEERSPATRLIGQDPKASVTSLEQLRPYYSRQGFETVWIQPAPPAEALEPIGNILFEKLDRDKNGRLSFKELEEAPSSLRKLDFDQNEMVSAGEIRGLPQIGVRRPIIQERRKPPEQERFFLIPPGAVSHRLVELCAQRYARSPGAVNSSLSREDLDISEDFFAAADANKDGRLALIEWETLLLSGKPDVIVTARFGAREPILDRVAVVEKAADIKPALTVAAGLMLEIGASKLIVSGRSFDTPNPRIKTLKRVLLRLDRDGNGYVDVMEGRQVFAKTFKEFDTDHDGQIFPDEYGRVLEPLSLLAQSQVRVEIDDMAMDMFSVLDGNSDQELSERELRQVVTTLSCWDQNGDREVNRNESQIRQRLHLAYAFLQQPGVATTSEAMPQRTVRRWENFGGGPNWFRGMDRNRDGDLSHREFLGSEEQFQQLDADKDGLITVAEAEAGTRAKP